MISPSRRLALAAGLALFALALWAAIDVLRVARDIQHGEDGLRGATAADLARPRGLSRVADDALKHFTRADRIARRSWPLGVARRVPLVGQQVAGVRSMTRAAVMVGRIGDDAARAVQARLDNAGDGAPVACWRPRPSEMVPSGGAVSATCCAARPLGATNGQRRP